MRIKDLLVPTAACLAATPSLACSPCRQYVQAGIFDASFTVRLMVMLLPVLAVMAIAAIFWLWGRKEAA